LAEAGLPVICVETRRMKAVLQAQQVNKSDRNDSLAVMSDMTAQPPFLLLPDGGNPPINCESHAAPVP
jgi:hypothetical protein